MMFVKRNLLYHELLVLPDVIPTSITMLNPEPAVSEVNLGAPIGVNITGLGHLPVRWHVPIPSYHQR